MSSSTSPPLSTSAPSPSPSPLPPPIPSVTPNPIKKANKPFLVHQNYKKRQAALSQNPPSPSSSQSTSILSTTLKTLLLTLLTSLVLSRAITQTWTWGHSSKYTNPHQVSSFSFLFLSLATDPPFLS